MRTISPSGLAAIDNGLVARRNAVWFAVGDGVGIWDDIYTLTTNGKTYEGQAGRFTISDIGSASDGSIQGVDVTLSSLDPSVYPFLAGTNWHQRDVLISVLLIDPVTLDVIDSQTWFRGVIDDAVTQDQEDGTASLVISCESTSRDMERRGALMRDEASQRRIADNDGFFKHVARVTQMEIWWGQKRDRAGPGRRPRRPPRRTIGTI